MLIICEIFKGVLYSSALASAAFLAVFAINKCFSSRLRGEWSYILWCIPVMRLILPSSFKCRLSFYNILPFKNISINASKLTNAHPISNIKGPYMQDVIYSTSIPSFDVASIIAVFWICAALFILAYITYCNMLSYYEFKKCKPSKNVHAYDLLEKAKDIMDISKEIKIVESKSIVSPSIYGLARPCIIMPEGFFESVSDESAKHILIHELAHHIRKDIFVNIITSVIQAFHWFNPIVHICISTMRNDMEKACDELALSNIESFEIDSYGNTLIQFASRFSSTHSPFAAGFLGVAKNKSLTRERILNIAHYSEFSDKGKNALCLCLFLMLSMLFLTDPLYAQNVSKQTDCISYKGMDFDFPIDSKFSKSFPHKYGYNIKCNNPLEPIRASHDGKVRLTGRDYEYGKYILVDHGKGISTLYAHCGEVNVNVGDLVEEGFVIAKTGYISTSNRGVGIYFEIRRTENEKQ